MLRLLPHGLLRLDPQDFVLQHVARGVGVDPERYTGFAWGFGIDRLAMARTGLADMRDLLDNDLRFISQF